jgi:hypothetical protein
MSRVADERRQPFDDSGSFIDDGFCLQRLATVRDDDSVRVFQISFNA